MQELSFNRTVAAYTYYGDGYIYRLNDSGRFNGVQVAVDDKTAKTTVVLTGFTTVARDGSTMYQTDENTWIDLTDGWQRDEQVEIYNQAQAQSYVTRMIDNNKQILMNNLLCARFSYRLTDEQKSELYSLQERLQTRNDRLLRDGLVTNIQSSQAYGYNALNSYLTSFMASGIGLVISTTAIVISCVVIGAVATAAYFAYKYYYEQSAKDVKFSDKLTRTLVSKLTEEEYNQLLQETQGIVTKASIRSRLGASFDFFKYGLIGMGIFAVYQLINERRKRHVKRKD